MYEINGWWWDIVRQQRKRRLQTQKKLQEPKQPWSRAAKRYVFIYSPNKVVTKRVLTLEKGKAKITNSVGLLQFDFKLQRKQNTAD